MKESMNPKRRAGAFTAIGCAFVVLAIVNEGMLKWPLFAIAFAFLISALVIKIRGRQSKT